jgi:hypothetical protein
MKMELIEDTNYYSIDGNTWTDLYDYGYSVSYSCDSNSDGEKDDTCTYNSKDYTEGAQNVIYAYTQDDINEVTIDSSIINSSNEIINNFYSFDDSKFKIDYSKLDKELETYYPTILDSNNIDYTNLFDINVDNTNEKILISKSNNSYIPVGTYKFTLYYDQDNSGEFDYQINSTLVVTKPFSINKIDVNTIYTDTTFNCLLKDYASTLTNDNLTYLIKLDSIDVTDKFNISYLSGSIYISPKESIEKGTYNLSISINGNDIETINFEVYEIYTLNYTPSENELRITTNSTSHEYTINDLKNNVSSRYGYSILNSNDEEINPELIGTGMKLKLNTTATESIIYTFVVLGDTNGDGMISALDYVKIKNHIMEKNIISKEVFLKAADVNEDEKITALDYVRIKNYIMAGGN